MIISYVDDNLAYVKYYMERSYEELGRKIIAEKNLITDYVEHNGTLVGYNITINKPLTELFGFVCYVVRFYIANGDTLHNEIQNKMCNELLGKLKKYISDNKGYYNLRIPTNIIDLIKAVNVNLENQIFCGGTIEEFTPGKKIEAATSNELKLFEADLSYIEKHRERLMQITYDSFKSYQGQYHISYVTESKAGDIYKNWIEGSLNVSSDNRVVIAEYKGDVVGYVTFTEKEYAVEAILSSVSEESRRLGAYKSMIAYLINFAGEVNKALVTSTQFDNLIVQGVWSKLGMKPFYSIYNIHVDAR